MQSVNVSKQQMSLLWRVISYARNITPKHFPCHGEKKQHVSLNIANCPSRALFCSEGAATSGKSLITVVKWLCSTMACETNSALGHLAFPLPSSTVVAAVLHLLFRSHRAMHPANSLRTPAAWWWASSGLCVWEAVGALSKAKNPPLVLTLRGAVLQPAPAFVFPPLWSYCPGEATAGGVRAVSNNTQIALLD